MYQLYIGANNDTKKVERKRIESILNKRFQAYTISNAVGYWNGQRENSVVVGIDAPSNEVMTAAQELKIALKQEAIGLQQVPNLEFI